MTAARALGDWRRLLLANRLAMYTLIGGVAAAIDVILFVLLYELVGVPALVAHSISIPMAAVYSFTCNAYLNFRTTDRLVRRAVSFATVVAIGYALGAAIIWAVEVGSAFGGTVGKLLSMPFVFFVQYYLNSRVSFRD